MYSLVPSIISYIFGRCLFFHPERYALSMKHNFLRSQEHKYTLVIRNISFQKASRVKLNCAEILKPWKTDQVFPFCPYAYTKLCMYV